MKNLNNDLRERGSDGCQFKNISSEVNTFQCDKISSNLNNGLY